ncbi:MAG: exodeoxyribonuclease VII small subunit [Nitrospinae bacterium]|nr:exodeoxyribonuclease VII small subunit [Nitrospinota bacterium]
MSTANESANPDAEPKSFEEALKRLEAIVEELEEGEPSLEKAVLLYEEGVKLFRYSREQLNAAQKKVEELVGESEETFSLQSFEDGEDDE